MCSYPLIRNATYCLASPRFQMLSPIFLTVTYELNIILSNSQMGNLKLREVAQVLTSQQRQSLHANPFQDLNDGAIDKGYFVSPAAGYVPPCSLLSRSKSQK